MNKILILLIVVAALAYACQQQTPEPKETYELLGYTTEEAFGEHLVLIMDCDVCHSPKMMTEHGPVPDPELRFSGHPASWTAADVDREVLEQNGYGACNGHFTAWTGPWGVSYAANLTSDATGIGSWSEENFFRAIREGTFKGMEGTRTLLPPMPWQAYSNATDDEISAIFAYLQTVPPVENIVPPPDPPLATMQ